jgi:hypothetical protein
MALRIGDSVFSRDGMPATVINRDDKSAKLELSNEKEKLNEATRHGYINGLTETTRGEFNSIMDSFKDIEDPKERTVEMRTQLTELEKDPRKHRIAKYVRAEMLHVMNTYGIKPTNFTVDTARTN